VMITSHADTLTDLSFVCLFIVQAVYRYHCPLGRSWGRPVLATRDREQP
jgi:hypothetical protein